MKRVTILAFITSLFVSAIAVANELKVPFSELRRLKVNLPLGRGRKIKCGKLTVFDETYMHTTHGRDLCMVIAVHELAHALTWSPNKKVEEANTYKYGVHGPDFGIVYAQLWTDVMEGKGPEDDNEV